MDKILGASTWYCIAGLFITAIVLGIRTIERDKKENNPFATIRFAFQLPALVLCVMLAMACSVFGLYILTH